MIIDDAYEREAWEQYELWLHAERQPGLIARAGARARAVGREALGRWEDTRAAAWAAQLAEAGASLKEQQAAQKAFQATMEALQGSYHAAVDLSLDAVRTSSVTKHYTDHLGEEAGLEGLKDLPLKVLDAERPNLRRSRTRRLTGVNGLSGAAAGMQMGGPTFAAVIAFDVASTIGLSVEAIGIQLAHYGYDVTTPDEHAYVMTLLQESVTSGATSKAILAQQARSLAVNLAKNKAWVELNKNLLTQIARQGFTLVGERLIKRKLATVLPGISAVVGVGQGYNLGRDLTDVAHYEGRARLLRDRWGDDRDVIDVELLGT